MKYFFGLFLSMFFLSGGILFAQEGVPTFPGFDSSTPTQEVETQVVATVEIYDAVIANPDGIAVDEDGNTLENTFNISFDLYNAKGVQPQVRYAVDLIRETDYGAEGRRQELMDRRVFDETISLNEGEARPTAVRYTAPEELNGTFQVWIVAINEQSLILAHNKVGEITLNGDGYPLFMPPRNCKLSVEGDTAFYEKVQGVDVGPEENLQLHCVVRNTTNSTLQFYPEFMNYYRSSFGAPVGGSVRGATFALGAGEVEEIVLDVPKATDPQSYDFGMTLKDANAGTPLSSTIYAHYVVRGLSGTIQTVLLDKDYYRNGDTAQVFVNWSGRADAFIGSRDQGQSFNEAIITMQIVSAENQANCSQEITRTYSISDNATTIPVPIGADCKDPQVNLKLADAEGSLLAQASFTAETKEDAQEGQFTVLVSIITVLVIAIAIGILYQKFHKDNMNTPSGGGARRARTTKALFFVLAPALFMFGGVSDAQAVTFSVGGNGGEGYYTASLDKGTYAPDSTMTISGSGKGGWSSAGYQHVELEATVNGARKSIVHNEGYADGFYGCPDNPLPGVFCSDSDLGDMSVYYDENTHQVGNTPGDYNAELRGWGANQYQYDNNFSWVAGTLDVAYTVSPPVPTLNLFAEQYKVDWGRSGGRIHWDVENADSCTASGDWSGSKSSTGGSEWPVTYYTEDKTFTLECSNFAGSSSDTINITVVNYPECADGADNDNDGATDYPNDPECSDDSDDGEGTTGDPTNECPFTAQQGRTIVEIVPEIRLVPHDEERHESVPISVSLSAGTYDITLASYDGYNGREDVPPQAREIWKAVFVSGGSEVAVSNTTTDLEDGVSAASRIDVVNEDFALSQSIDTIIARHGVLDSDGNYSQSGGSVIPVCAAIDLVQVTQCSDGIDNDGDGLIDLNDPGCESANDDDETDTGPEPQCSDGADNDGDGEIDYPADIGCVSEDDDDETNPQCSDGIDNDGDTLIDLNDPGCTSPNDNDESNPQCSDEIDNDGDTLVDFPNDPGCTSETDDDESTKECSDGDDNDNDGFIDYPDDPECVSPDDDVEASQCSDEIDNDGDGEIDYPADIGCTSPSDNSESNPQCSDEIDNDGDNLTDYPEDLGCTSPTDNDETNAECSDGIDNDNDGFTDYPDDNGCQDVFDDSEFLTPDFIEF